MNKNIFILIFLALMTGAAIYAVSLFNQLEKEKKEKQIALIRLDALLKQVETQQKKIDSMSIATITELSEKSSSENMGISVATDSAKTVLVRKYKTANEDYIKLNDSSTYQTASKLEKEGFAAIANNQLGIAYEKFKQLVSIAPSFHSSYEIYRMLGKQKVNFNNPETQQNIKEQILKNYTWKAPTEQIKKIELQVKQKATVSTVQVQQVAVKPPALKDTASKTQAIQAAKTQLQVKPANNLKNLYNSKTGVKQ